LVSICVAAARRRVVYSWSVASGLTRACAAVAIALSAVCAGAGARISAAPGCDAAASSAYAAHIAAAVRSGRDVWGNALLAERNGPTLGKARSYLHPLLWARTAHQRPLTTSGAYYLPFAEPDETHGSSAAHLHVADGSQIVDNQIGGRSLGIFVGPGGRERFGSCRSRAGQASLADGWLPILETSYSDAAGARYRQESFADRVHGGPLTSFIRLDVDARKATRAVTVRFVPGSAFRVPRGAERTVDIAWPSGDATGYDAARQHVVDLWQSRLAPGMSIQVPDPEVVDAERALQVQELELTWRYSIGNPYEEFSFPEGLDVAMVLAEQGFLSAAESVVRTSLTRKPTPYPNWKKGERLLATAEIYRLGDAAAFVRQVTPVLRGYVSELGRQIDGNPSGLLDKERYSSDIPDQVYGFHSQAIVWQGLREMAPVWAATGRRALAATCRRLAARLEHGLRRAVADSQRRLADGSLFVPASLLDDERPYRMLTDERLGSYWNLVMPYALASGFFAPGSPQARGVLRYIELHGSRLLGLVRAGSYALYGQDSPRMSGTDAVYNLNIARFLADNDEADQLGLSLIGYLAAGMTTNTFVSGEAASVTPLPGTGYRAMYLPPNGCSNGAFLETLRSMLVHETRDRAGQPYGLQLAFAALRRWLLPGRHIVVQNAPTSFGQVSYSITTAPRAVSVTVTGPSRTRPKTMAIRLRLPRGARLLGVTFGGRRWTRFDATTGTIQLPLTRGTITLVARRSAA
jgi:hypothetical protein